jgi:hypothetical protein
LSNGGTSAASIEEEKMSDTYRFDDDGRPVWPSRKTGQDELANRVKQAAKQFLALLKRLKGKNKDAGDRENASSYFKGLNHNLPLLFSHRWERSPAEPLWNNFVAVWNNGDCSWTDAYKALEPLNDGLQQSE